MYNCKYTEIVSYDTIKDNIENLSKSIFIAGKKKNKEIYPVVIGSRALVRLAANSCEDYSSQLFNKYNAKIQEPKDWDLIMTPQQSHEIVINNADKPMKLYILDMGESFNNKKYYKLIVENGKDTLDISIITDYNQGMYMLATICQNFPNKTIKKIGMKFVCANANMLRILKTINLYYSKNFEKNLGDYLLLEKIIDGNVQDYNQILESFKKEAQIIRGPIKSVGEFDKTLHNDEIISYTIDKFLQTGISHDILQSVKDNAQLFCNSQDGEKYWNKYNHITKLYDLRSQITKKYNDEKFNRLSQEEKDKIKLEKEENDKKIAIAMEKRRIEIDEIMAEKERQGKINYIKEKYEDYFPADMRDQAKIDGETAEILTIDEYRSITFTIKSQKYTIKYNINTNEEIPFSLKLICNNKEYLLIEISYYRTYSSSDSATRWTIKKYNPFYESKVVGFVLGQKPYENQDFILYLVRLAMIYIPITFACAYSYGTVNKKEHQIVALYLGKRAEYFKDNNSLTGNWVNDYTS